MVAMEILSRETIKPSSPTPPHLKSYKLSLLDQLIFNMYMPMLYFYPDNKGISESTASKSSVLKTSLSETLTLYYPFAGRLTDDMLSIDCNEEGVDFWEARIESPMSEFLKQSNPQGLNLLVPAGIAWNKLADDSSLMVVQLSHFDCGGTALSVCITHKVGDACTMNSFMTDWAATAAAALQSGKQTPPVFISSCLLPSPNNVPVIVQELEPEQRKCVTKRFFFDASRVARLRTVIADSSSGVLKKPTRVEVVTALLYKCAMVKGKVNSGSFKMSRLMQSVNMRQRVIPPLPNNSIGNFSWYVTISTEDESELNLLGLVGKLRNGIAQLCDQSKNDLEMNEWVTGIWKSMEEVKVVLHDLEVYMCSSFCGYPLYGADYGWGKPMLVRMASGVFKNAFVLMDSEKGDGIEAWVTLEEQDMEVFQRDEELLAFASLS